MLYIQWTADTNTSYHIVQNFGGNKIFGKFVCNRQNFTLQNFPAHLGIIDIAKICEVHKSSGGSSSTLLNKVDEEPGLLPDQDSS